MIELPKRKLMFIGHETPSGGDPTYCGWIDTATRTIKTWENGQWVVQASFGTVGYTGVIKAGNNDFTFENGVLVSYE